MRCAGGARANSWKELKSENRWIFCIKNRLKFTVICGDNVSHEEVEGDGIFELGNQCIMRTDKFVIESKYTINNNNTNKIIIPKFLHDNLLSKKRIENGKENMVKNDSETNINLEIENLEKMIQNIEENSSLNNHDIHHYTISYTTVAVVLIFIVLILRYKFKLAKTIKSNETENIHDRPVVVSMPNLNSNDTAYSGRQNVTT